VRNEADLDGATYLSDGLYAKHSPWEITLFAHNGIHTTNKVYLEAVTLRRFLDYLDKHGLTPCASRGLE
jgi:hypothetical protein